MYKAINLILTIALRSSSPSAFRILYKMYNNFIFDDKLQEGLIVKRKSQFTMLVIINNNEVNCHYPTTGRI